MNPSTASRHQPTRPRHRHPSARALFLAAACWLTGSAHAAWLVDGTSTATVELTFMAWENNGSTPKLVFVKDLGKTMTDFFVSGQVDAGTQLSWYLGGTDDTTWTTFLNTDVTAGVKADISKVKWAVFAMAQPGGADPVPGAYQLYTTNLQGLSGSPTVISGISTITSDAFVNSAAALGAFYGGNTNSGTLGSATDGSALLKSTDGPSRFPWDPFLGLGSADQLTYGGAFPRGAGNLVGQSSWFYYVTGGAEFDSTVPVVVDEFDNLTNDGYWGLAAASAADKAGQYFLSYNLGGSVSTLEASSGTLASNNFARLAGVLSLSSSAGKSQTVLSMTESFLRGFSKVAATLPAAAEDTAHALASDGGLDLPSPSVNISAVPETGSAALMAAGLALLASVHLRRRAAARS